MLLPAYAIPCLKSHGEEKGEGGGGRKGKRGGEEGKEERGGGRKRKRGEGEGKG